MTSHLSSGFLIFIALLILRSSVAAPDELYYQSNSDTTVSRIEKWVDLVCEFAVDFHSQFPVKKNDHATHHHRHLKKVSPVKIYDAPVAYKTTGFSYTAYQLPQFHPSPITSFKKDILSPPPQQA